MEKTLKEANVLHSPESKKGKSIEDIRKVFYSSYRILTTLAHVEEGDVYLPLLH